MKEDWGQANDLKSGRALENKEKESQKKRWWSQMRWQM